MHKSIRSDEIYRKVLSEVCDIVAMLLTTVFKTTVGRDTSDGKKKYHTHF